MFALLKMLWVLTKACSSGSNSTWRLVTPISPILKHLTDIANASSGWFRIILCRIVSMFAVCSLTYSMVQSPSWEANQCTSQLVKKFPAFMEPESPSPYPHNRNCIPVDTGRKTCLQQLACAGNTVLPSWSRHFYSFKEICSTKSACYLLNAKSKISKLCPRETVWTWH